MNCGNKKDRYGLGFKAGKPLFDSCNRLIKPSSPEGKQPYVIIRNTKLRVDSWSPETVVTPLGTFPSTDVKKFFIGRDRDTYVLPGDFSFEVRWNFIVFYSVDFIKSSWEPVYSLRRAFKRYINKHILRYNFTINDSQAIALMKNRYKTFPPPVNIKNNLSPKTPEDFIEVDEADTDKNHKKDDEAPELHQTAWKESDKNAVSELLSGVRQLGGAFVDESLLVDNIRTTCLRKRHVAWALAMYACVDEDLGKLRAMIESEVMLEFPGTSELSHGVLLKAIKICESEFRMLSGIITLSWKKIYSVCATIRTTVSASLRLIANYICKKYPSYKTDYFDDSYLDYIASIDQGSEFSTKTAETRNYLETYKCVPDLHNMQRREEEFRFEATKSLEQIQKIQNTIPYCQDQFRAIQQDLLIFSDDIEHVHIRKLKTQDDTDDETDDSENFQTKYQHFTRYYIDITRLIDQKQG